MHNVYPKYRKRPIDIEAVKVGKNNLDWITSLMFMGIDEETIEDPETINLIIADQGIEVITKDGPVKAEFGDYIIKGVMGDFFVSKADVFEKYWEKVEETPKIFGEKGATFDEQA